MMLQSFIRQYMAPVVFLVAYFVTVVLGNLIYATPLGEDFLALAYLPNTLLTLPGVFGPLYWLLLLAPFVLTPIVVFVTQRIMRRPVAAMASVMLPNISAATYIVITGTLIGVAAYIFLRSGALELFVSGTNAVQAVEARFLLQERLGFWGLVIVQALLPFLGYLAVINASKGGGRFWLTIALVVCFIVAIFLLLLNMKWPMLLFFCGIGLSVFVYSKSRPYIKAMLAFIAILIAYLLISTFLFRSVDTSPDPSVRIESDKMVGNLERVAELNSRLFSGAFWAAPRLVAFAANRMATIYPYYLSIFSYNPGACGDLINYLKVGAGCRPSTFIYQRIFASDGFEGRGTAPAAVHVTAFALGGLPLATVALVLASVLMGLFSALPTQGNATVGAVAIIGAIAGYHWSQLPGEGPLLYDHGLMWPFLLLLVTFSVQGVLVAAMGKLRKRSHQHLQ